MTDGRYGVTPAPPAPVPTPDRGRCAPRHTWATLALVAGVDVKIVSERLGHPSPMVTWQSYQHVITGMQSDAAERVAALVLPAHGA